METFSIAPSQATRACSDYKRRSKLREALEKNQPLKFNLSAMLQKAIRIAVLNLRQDYDQRSRVNSNSKCTDLWNDIGVKC